MNYLKAVFWDYPQFTDGNTLKKYIRESKNSSLYLWILKRFLEHGRAVDAISYFGMDEIVEKLNELKLGPYTHRKWERIIEVYGASDRR